MNFEKRGGLLIVVDIELCVGVSLLSCFERNTDKVLAEDDGEN